MKGWVAMQIGEAVREIVEAAKELTSERVVLNSHRQQVLALALSLALRKARAIQVLVNAGLAREALPITRSVLELGLNLMFIEHDPAGAEKLYEQFWGYLACAQEKMLEETELLESHPKRDAVRNRAQSVRDAYGWGSKTPSDWHKSNLCYRAQCAGRKGDYDRAYRYTSQFVHSSALSMVMSVEWTDSDRLIFCDADEKDDARHALAPVGQYLANIAQLYARALLPDKLDALVARLQDIRDRYDMTNGCEEPM